MINSIFKCLLILVIIVECQASYNIYLKRVKCFHIDKKLVSLKRCEVKAERGKKGVLYAHVDFNYPITREMKIWMRVRLFWQGSNARFNPYLVDVRGEVCEQYKFLQSNNPLIKLIVNVAYSLANQQIIDDVIDGCPINASIDIKGWHAHTHLGRVLPPITPAGAFKVIINWYNENQTFGDVEVIVELRPIGLSDAIVLG